MPRARFNESLFKRDRLGRFAKSVGGGKPRPKKLRPGATNAQRRELGRKKLKAANTVRGHEDYAEKNADRVAAGKPELAGIGNTRKQLPRAQDRLREADRLLQGLYLDRDTHEQAKKVLAGELGKSRKTTTGKAGSSRTAKGLSKEKQDQIQLNARAKKVARERAAEDARPSSLRRKLIAAEKKVGDMFNNMDFDAFRAMSEDEKTEFREKRMGIVDETTQLEEQLKNAKPDRSRKIADAKTLGEVVDIMADRYPGLTMDGWDEPDGALSKAMNDYDPAGTRRDMTLRKVQQAFQGLDAMLQKYPDIELELGFNAWPSTQFSSPNAIAHCRRGPFLGIDFNVSFLTTKNPAGNEKKDGSIGFHPANFAERPWRNTVIHEFGHAVDWYAFGFKDVYEKSEKKFREEEEAEKKGGPKGRTRAQIQETTQQAIGIGRGEDMKRAIAGLFVEAGEPDVRSIADQLSSQRLSSPELTKVKLKAWMKTQMSGYSFHPNTDAVMFDDEALAEAWQDYHANGDNASDTSKVLAKMMLDGLEGGKAGREARLREKIIQSYMNLGMTRKKAEEAADGQVA